MSDIESVAKLELLPNEILNQCFRYFHACDLLHSFDHLNSRFNHLIRHIPLCIDFENVNKSVFDEFCTKMSLDSEMKNQVYSLHLPNDDICLQTKRFWSLFSYNEFSNLHTFISNISLAPCRIKFRREPTEELGAQIKIVDLLYSNLQTLSIFKLDRLETQQILSITNMTLSVCDLAGFNALLVHVPMLKYLSINHLKYEFDNVVDETFKGQRHAHLKELIINNFLGKFTQFELTVKQTPNLKRLAISTYDTEDMVDADRWEQLITSILPELTIFQFKFVCLLSEEMSDIPKKFRQFQSDFWQKEHNWLIEVIGNEKSASIFTVPYPTYIFEVSSDHERYHNNLRSDLNTFRNVTHLTLSHETLTKNCQYYFPSVSASTLVPVDAGYLSSTTPHFRTSFEIEHVEYLGKTVNLSNLTHLDISDYDGLPINSSTLLQLFEKAPQLSSLATNWNQLTLFFSDIDLRKYLNERIKKLQIRGQNNSSMDDIFNAGEFCQVFSNIEHLRCENSHGDQLLFLLHRLRKLVTLEATWLTKSDPEENLIRFENEVQKLNAICDVRTQCYQGIRLRDYNGFVKGTCYYMNARIWFGSNISREEIF